MQEKIVYSEEVELTTFQSKYLKEIILIDILLPDFQKVVLEKLINLIKLAKSKGYDESDLRIQCDSTPTFTRLGTVTFTFFTPHWRETLVYNTGYLEVNKSFTKQENEAIHKKTKLFENHFKYLKEREEEKDEDKS